MSNIAYLRISKDGQDIDNQRFALLDYAHRRSIKIDKFIEISISSRKSIQNMYKRLKVYLIEYQIVINRLRQTVATLLLGQFRW